MTFNTVVYFLSLTISFFLFFFNVPYWTGRDMADMSKSGIWRAFFRFLSFLGYGLHRLYMHFAGWVLDFPLRFRKRGEFQEGERFWPGVAGFVDALCSAGTLYLLITAYNNLMNSLFPAGVSSLAKGSDGSLLRNLSEAVVFLRVVSDFNPGSGFGGVVAAVVVTLIAVVLYIIINTLFFSILFGFLREMLREEPFLEIAKERLNIPPAPPAEPTEEESPLQSLLRQLKGATEKFFNKTTLHHFAYEPVALVLVLLAMLAFSVVMTRLGKNDLGPLDVVKRVLDSIGVVQIIASFLVTYLAGKLTEKTAKSVVKVLPQGMQRAIHAASAKGNAWADAEDAKRHIWSQEHQARQETPPAQEPPKPSAPPAYTPPQEPPKPAPPPAYTPPQEDAGLVAIRDAVDLVNTTFQKATGSTEQVSWQEIFDLLDSGAVVDVHGQAIEGWKNLTTDVERGKFIRKNVVHIGVALMNKREG